MDDDAVHQVLSAASDAEIDAVLEAAAQLPGERCKRRGPLLAKHMQEVKARRRLERQGKLAPRAQSLVQVYNEDMAKTASHTIGPLQRRREKQRGLRGRAKWLPTLANGFAGACDSGMR